MGAARPPLPAGRVVTPVPESSPIMTAVQHQSNGAARGFRPEGTQDWLIVGTMRGLGYCRADGKTTILKRGDILLFAPQTPQDYGYLDEDGDWLNIWAHFRPRPHWIPWLVWPQKAKGVMVLSTGDAFDGIETELKRMVEVAGHPTRLRLDRSLNALERVLIDCDALNPLQKTGQLDPRIRKALEIVGEKMAAPLNIDGLSRAVGLSRSRFSVLFTEQTNLSPQAYIEFVRLNRAAQLLIMSSWPVGHIAEEVGFPNAYYFSTRFRARYGMPPTAFRARHDAKSELNPSADGLTRGPAPVLQ